MTAVYVLIGAAVLLILLYLFLICPANGKKAKAFDGKFIAHRGLHGEGIKENTLPAFEKAVKMGYGVELDVHLSSDKIPVVHHDSSLKRVFGIDRPLKDLTASELNEIGVPTFRQVLDVLDGKVPLVTEIKGEDFNTEVCERTAEVLKGYDGIYCVESFNPMHLRWFKRNCPSVIRGQLSTVFDKKKSFVTNLRNGFLKNLLLNVLSRPHFIAYEHKHYPLSVRLCVLLGAHPVCWTTRSKDESDKASKHYKTFIFEDYEP